MLKWITDYIEQVEKYPLKFNRNIKNQCRLIKELISRKNIAYKEADPIAFEKFCHLFTHQKGEWAGQPFIPDITQRFDIACVLGIKYYDKEKKRWLRYFRHNHIFVARKWGKSFLASAFVLWMLGLDKENGAEVRVVAENKEQSARLFKTVDESRKTSEHLKKFFKKRYNKDTCAYEIYCKDANGMDCIFTYVSGRTKGQDGDSNNAIISDEIHEVTRHEVYDSKITGQGARIQPLSIAISTAGITPNSLYERLYDSNLKYLEKKKYGKDDRVFSLMFGLDPEDDIEDTTKWVKANPALNEGRPTLQYLKLQYNLAKDDPIALASFTAKHLNRQVGAALDFYDMGDIKKCCAPITKEMFFDTYGTGGVDLASTTDLCNATAKILLKDGRSLILQAYFIASDCLGRNSKKDKQDYNYFTSINTENEITSRLVIITEGATVNFKAVTQWFVTLREEYKISFLKIGYDKAMANYWIADMVENGFAHEKVTFDKENRVETRDDGILTPCYQGIGLDPAIRIARTLFELKKYVVDTNNKLLPYCFYNVRVVSNTDNKLSVNKAKSNGHVDGCIGLYNSEIAYERAKQIYAEQIPDYFKI
jgi:phage terminase large subunit-like protein